MAKAFNVTVDYLLFDNDAPSPATSSTPASPTPTNTPVKNAPPSPTSIDPLVTQAKLRLITGGAG